jgi:hypothetical protein
MTISFDLNVFRILTTNVIHKVVSNVQTYNKSKTRPLK